MYLALADLPGGSNALLNTAVHYTASREVYGSSDRLITFGISVFIAVLYNLKDIA